MIDYINNRLVSWANWATKRDEGCGYPRQSHYTKLVHSHGVGSIEEINEEAMEIETAVLALRNDRQELHAVIMEFYRKTGSAEYKARALHICRDTLYARLHQAHIWIMNWMQDKDAEQWDRQRLQKNLRAAA